MMAYGIAFHEGDLGELEPGAEHRLLWVELFHERRGPRNVVETAARRGLPVGSMPMPVDMPLCKGAVLITLFLSLALPMVGLTVLAVLLFGIALVARIPALKRFMS